MKLKDHKYLLLILAVSGTLYALISIVNHYLFRTYALDLGLYTNALFKYSRFQMADSYMINESYESMLGGHFDLYLMLFSPLRYVFGTFTLLIVQIVFLLLGGIGIFRYFTIKENSSARIAHFATIYFFVFFGVFSAVSFDYHSVVIASSLIPWFFYQFHRQKYVQSSILLIVILLSQENVSLLMLFIALGLMIEYRKNRVALYLLAAYSVISMFYFMVVTQVLIPSFSAADSYTGFLYSSLGDTPLEALGNLFVHPVHNFKVLFMNHNDSLFGDYVKLETHLILLCSGTLLLIVKPQYLLMLVPLYGQKFFHDDPQMWGVGGQYSIEFAPILAIGIFSVIIGLKNRTARSVLIVLAMVGAIGSTIRVMDNTLQFTNKTAIRFYQKAHYVRNYDVTIVHRQLNLIPKSAKVSAQSPFVPHLALRNTVYQFPVIKDAEYIIVSTKESSYPMTRMDFIQEINELLNSRIWKPAFMNEHLTVLKRVETKPE